MGTTLVVIRSVLDSSDQVLIGVFGPQYHAQEMLDLCHTLLTRVLLSLTTRQVESLDPEDVRLCALRLTKCMRLPPIKSEDTPVSGMPTMPKRI